jgi:hypothetical protein
MRPDDRAPWVGFGRRIEIKSRFRSAISPWIDRRQKLDIIREKLEERGLALLRQSERCLTNGSLGSSDLDKAGILLVSGGAKSTSRRRDASQPSG